MPFDSVNTDTMFSILSRLSLHHGAGTSKSTASYMEMNLRHTASAVEQRFHQIHGAYYCLTYCSLPLQHDDRQQPASSHCGFLVKDATSKAVGVGTVAAADFPKHIKRLTNPNTSTKLREFTHQHLTTSRGQMRSATLHNSLIK